MLATRHLQHGVEPVHPYLSDAIIIIAETGYYHRQAHRNVWGE